MKPIWTVKYVNAMEPLKTMEPKRHVHLHQKVADCWLLWIDAINRPGAQSDLKHASQHHERALAKHEGGVDPNGVGILGVRRDVLAKVRCHISVDVAQGVEGAQGQVNEEAPQHGWHASVVEARHVRHRHRFRQLSAHLNALTLSDNSWPLFLVHMLSTLTVVSPIPIRMNFRWVIPTMIWQLLRPTVTYSGLK